MVGSHHSNIARSYSVQSLYSYSFVDIISAKAQSLMCHFRTSVNNRDELRDDVEILVSLAGGIVNLPPLHLSSTWRDI